MPLEFRVMQDDFDRIALLPEPKWELDELYLGKLLRYLPLRAALARMREFVSPGGLILALDFFDPTGHEGFLEKLTESTLSRARRFLHTGRWLPPPEVQEAWRQHGQHDEKPTWVEAKATIFTELSGALRGRVRG